jgi:hypothetical protein
MFMRSSALIRSVFLVLLSLFLGGVSLQATNSEEETLKRIQQAKYNMFTGIWSIRLNEEIRDVESGFKAHLPGLDYTLVDEKIREAGRTVMVFRGKGDQKLVVRLKETGPYTNLSIRIGVTGNNSKSAQIFGYVYRKM